jgi:hypothetical protein
MAFAAKGSGISTGMKARQAGVFAGSSIDAQGDFFGHSF